MAELLGAEDANRKLLERRLGVRIAARGRKLTILGPPATQQRAVRIIEELLARLRSGTALFLKEVDHVIDLEGDPTPSLLTDGEHSEPFVMQGGRIVKAKSLNQTRYLSALAESDLVFATGPAGTGKTFLAMACAISALRKREVERIVLARPAVEAGERLGFLPGTLVDKVNPYLRPLHDALYDLMGFEPALRLIDGGTVEVAPLAFMRGRTLNRSFVILDEAQNTTTEQMKMFLTRLGDGSRAVVTGDVTQIDLAPGQVSGLVHATEVLRHVKKGISFIEMKAVDVLRHRLVRDIVQAYDQHARRRGPG